MTNEERWLANYEALKAHVAETGHFPNKHDKRQSSSSKGNYRQNGSR